MFEAMIENIKATGIPCAHYGWREAPKDRYIVWAEDGSDAQISAEGQNAERAITGTLDLFVKTDDMQDMRAVEAAFNRSRVAWYLNSVQYEDDTGLIHYEWVWEVPDSGTA